MEQRWPREKLRACSTTIQAWAWCGTRMRATNWRSRRRAKRAFIFRWRRSSCWRKIMGGQMAAEMTVDEVFNLGNLIPNAPVPWRTKVSEHCAGIYVVALTKEANCRV